MKKNTAKSISDFIVPLYINGLQGRMLRLPAPKGKQKEILIIYGHHASLERMAGVAEDLNQYGAVTMPDLPGFGGMESFYKIGLPPTLDNLADYLASFVKLGYKRKRVTILGMSLGFAVVTRMLQRYPELSKKVDLLVSVVGFAHKDDFRFRRRTYWTFKLLTGFFSYRLPAWFFKTFLLRSLVIRMAYRLAGDNHSKLQDADKEERNRRIKFEIGLWQCNDLRTYMKTGRAMLDIDLCGSQVDLPVYHVAVEPDRYFDNKIVEQHMRIIFSRFTKVKSKIKGHAPTVVADATAAAVFIPTRIRRLLAKA